MKCTREKCSDPADYVVGGNSYCETHAKEAKGNLTYNGVRLYLTGVGIWVIIWIILFALNSQSNLNLFGGGKYSPFFILPFALGTATLVINAYLSRSVTFADYKTEVDVIAFVERNSSWFIIGSSAVFGWASLARGQLGLTFSPTPFIIYISLTLILLCPVILLYWIPYHPTLSNLGRLRHWKTIPFTYSVSFFTAAVLTLMIGALP